VAALAVGVILAAAGAALIMLARGAGGTSAGPLGSPTRWLAVLALAAAAGTRGGLTAVAPGEGRMIQMFGRYVGTIRSPGLHWVNPLAHRHRVSTRLR